NRPGWQRKGLQSLPNHIGQRIEAFAIADGGEALPAMATVAEVNKVYADAGCKQSDTTCPALTEREIIRRVAKTRHEDPEYADKALQIYCRLYRPGCVEGNTPPPQFTIDVSTAGAFNGTRATSFTDVTGDGKADVIAVNDNSVTVRTSDGTSFGPAQT